MKGSDVPSEKDKQQFNAALDAIKIKEAEKAGGSGCAMFFILGFLTWVFIDHKWYNYLFWGSAAFGVMSVVSFARAAKIKKRYK